MSKKDLGRRSMPRNPLLFSLMQRVHLVEKVGSGFKRVHEEMTKAGLDDPIIETDENWFSVVFKRPKKVGEKVGEKITENQEKIMVLMKKSPSISSKAMAEKVGISSRKIEVNIKKLKQMNAIERVGSAKGGYWKVKD